jgi:hypothetical protein
MATKVLTNEEEHLVITAIAAISSAAVTQGFLNSDTGLKASLKGAVVVGLFTAYLVYTKY